MNPAIQAAVIAALITGLKRRPLMANELSRVWLFNDEPKYDSNVKQRKKKQAAPQFSKCLEDFAAMVRRAQSDYAWNTEEVNSGLSP